VHGNASIAKAIGSIFLKTANDGLSVARKPIELPPAVARRFVEDMRAFHAEKNSVKADGIAARQLHAS
jgi:hypothetical protein